jgi:hypothetical protein
LKTGSLLLTTILQKTIYGVWGGGSGWTGQPLIINWNQEQKEKLHITDQEFLNDPNAMEVIIGSLCGDIYFLNSETGAASRNPLSIHNTIKGTVSVDPTQKRPIVCWTRNSTHWQNGRLCF